MLTALEYAQQYQPRLPGLPHTAPVYDRVTEPTQAPYPAVCLASGKRCQCYTQQGTRLDTPEALCRDIAASGFFLAWTPTGERVQAPPATPAPRPAPAEPTPAGYASFNAPTAPEFVAQAPEPDAGSLPRRVRRVAQ